VRIGLLSACTAAAICAFSLAASGAEPSYDELVAKAQSDGIGVDYMALRLAYARSDNADVSGLSLESAIAPMLEAANGGDCAKAIDASDTVLKQNFINILAHLVRSACFNKMGELGRAAREDTIVQGLRDSIFASGDGKSEKTAFVVVTLDEERFVLSTKGLRESGQALLGGGGHSYDLLTGVAKDGTSEQVYFQIDAMMASEDRMFTKP
jgi:Domain of unknown function (DUF4919)